MAKYSYKLKLKIVLEYIDGKGGFKYLANKYNIKSKTQVIQWVSQFRKYGVTGISKNQGRPLIMEDNKTKKKINNENNSTIEKLNLELVNCKAELLNYKIENAYLKELRRLRLEETLKMKK